MSDTKSIVRPFYEKCLTVNAETNLAETMGSILAENFQSKGSMDVKNKAQLIGQIQFFWQLVPDLKWEIQEMIAEGNQVVVRSLASGHPVGNFMGVPVDGSKGFRTMTIDIHTVQDGQVVQVHHLEDWATAIKQLQG
ncbi:MAG TPA: ester cyclase [Anaerolineales bacterium]|nr:ester cyclase [Anaerolineales bacterium]